VVVTSSSPPAFRCEPEGTPAFVSLLVAIFLASIVGIGIVQATIRAKKIWERSDAGEANDEVHGRLGFGAVAHFCSFTAQNIFVFSPFLALKKNPYMGLLLTDGGRPLVSRHTQACRQLRSQKSPHKMRLAADDGFKHTLSLER
jgi:hypothetical protein